MGRKKIVVWIYCHPPIKNWRHLGVAYEAVWIFTELSNALHHTSTCRQYFDQPRTREGCVFTPLSSTLSEKGMVRIRYTCWMFVSDKTSTSGDDVTWSHLFVHWSSVAGCHNGNIYLSHPGHHGSLSTELPVSAVWQSAVLHGLSPRWMLQSHKHSTKLWTFLLQWRGNELCQTGDMIIASLFVCYISFFTITYLFLFFRHPHLLAGCKLNFKKLVVNRTTTFKQLVIELLVKFVELLHELEIGITRVHTSASTNASRARGLLHVTMVHI